MNGDCSITPLDFLMDIYNRGNILDMAGNQGSFGNFSEIWGYSQSHALGVISLFMDNDASTRSFIYSK